MTDVNVLVGPLIAEEDPGTFFGPIEEGDFFFRIDGRKTMLDLLVELGFFTSKGQARKAGWSTKIPNGYTEYTIGKKKRRVCILNPDRLHDHYFMDGGGI